MGVGRGSLCPQGEHVTVGDPVLSSCEASDPHSDPGTPPRSTEPQESPQATTHLSGLLLKGPSLVTGDLPISQHEVDIFSATRQMAAALSESMHFWNAQTPSQHDGSCRHPCGKTGPRPAAGPPCVVLIAGPWGPVGAGAREERDSCGRRHPMLQACAPVPRAHRWPRTLPCRSKPPGPAFSL